MLTVIVQWTDKDFQTPKTISLSLPMEKRYASEAGSLPKRHQKWCRPWRPNCQGLLKCMMGDYPCVQLKMMKNGVFGEGNEETRWVEQLQLASMCMHLRQHCCARNLLPYMVHIVKVALCIPTGCFYVCTSLRNNNPNAFGSPERAPG